MIGKIFLEIIILGLFCNGLKIATEEGMIFYKPAKWLDSKLPVFISKPLFSCVYCMASIWGVVVHSFFYWFSSWYYLPIIVLCGVFMNGYMRLTYDIMYEYWLSLKHGFDEELKKLD